MPPLPGKPGAVAGPLKELVTMRNNVLALFFWLLMISGAGFRPGIAQAQSTVSSFEQITIEFWPDYDRPAVLVLLTGSLPAGSSLPATVTLPFPAGATLHAVARITSDGTLIDDIQFTPGSNALTLTTPESRFRVEYYLPYQADGLERNFTFGWLADLPVGNLAVRVQQPTAALAMQTTPLAEVITEGNDGLRYHTLAVQAAPAGQLLTIEFNYTMGSNQLTSQAGTQSNSQIPITSAAPTQTFNWPVLLAAAGGLLLLIGLGWQLVISGQQKRGRPARPRPERPARPQTQHASAVKFCHECGVAFRPGDRFCRQCGQTLKS